MGFGIRPSIVGKRWYQEDMLPMERPEAVKWAILASTDADADDGLSPDHTLEYDFRVGWLTA